MLFSCPACQRQLNIPDSAAGQQVRCPLCQAVFAVPSAAPVSVAPQGRDRTSASRRGEDAAPGRNTR
jgi:predicted Zn finger-like uncharacterized protein